jgi:glucan phosphoethanolaminetransferase (alkaline phosphatase superfamily)
MPPSPSNQTVATKVGFKVVVVAVFIVIILVSTFAFMKTRRDVASSEGLVYPGARIAVAMVAEGGGRALQLETADSLQKVEEWYRNSMKPGKTIQLTTNSVVLKNEKATVTIVNEENKTNILIKILP